MAARQIPLFPLGVVLFPQAPQALHIFEPRYRQMLTDCLSTEAEFGLSYVEAEGSESPPPPGSVGCLARIVEVQASGDGRSNIFTLGGSRYRVIRYVETSKPYAVAQVETFDDESEFVSPDDVQKLKDSFQEYLRLRTEFIAGLAPTFELEVDESSLSFQIAAVVELDLQAKYELLALTSTQERIDHLNEVMPRLIESGRSVKRIQKKAKKNGQRPR